MFVSGRVVTITLRERTKPFSFLILNFSSQYKLNFKKLKPKTIDNLNLEILRNLKTSRNFR
jgi:hypothetical protein